MAIFLLVFIPTVNAETYCDGEMCLTYIDKYVNPHGSGSWSLDTNDTTNLNPENFFIAKRLGSGSSTIYVLNETFNSSYTISTGVYDFTTFWGWYNDSGTEKFIGHRNFVGTDYARQYHNNGTYIISYATGTTDLDPEGDWYNDRFYIAHETQFKEWNTTFSTLSSCILDAQIKTGGHHANTQGDKYFFTNELAHELVIYNHDSCQENGTIDLDSFTQFSGNSVMGITTNYADTKLYLTAGNEIYEFGLNISYNSSEFTPVYPTTNANILENDIVMRAELTAGTTGTATCYINDTLKYTNSSIEIGTNNIRFDSGTLADGQYYWFCNFTDYSSNVWDFDSNVNFEITTGVIVELGDDIAQGLGFDTDEYSTAGEKGMAFLSIILSLMMGLGMGVVSQNAGLGGIGVLCGIILFVFIGWLPIWIGILMVIIAGIIVAKMLQDSF